METTFVSSGMWASMLLGSLLLVPVILEFFKKNLPICFGLTTTLITIYCLTPYSAGAREVWTPISHIPQGFVETVNGWMTPSTENPAPH